MGIKFRCQGCDKKLHVKAFLAGKRGVCPHCGTKVRIPLASEQAEGSAAPVPRGRRAEHTAQKTAATKSAPPPSSSSSHPATTSALRQRSDSSSTPARSDADPISESPEAVWYVRPPTGGQFGPADGDIIRRWLDEGRVSADSLVWREGWDDWKTADSVFPSLRRASTQTAGPTVADGSAAAEASAAGQPLTGSAEERFSIGEGKSVSKHTKTRLPSGSNARNVAIVVTLTIVCVGLLIALLVVLQNQG